MRLQLAPVWQIIGPLALLVDFALAWVIPLSAFPLDFFAAGTIGLYFCARWHIKGCSYSLMLLAVTGIAIHGFFEVHHFLRLGLEASFACSFFIAALVFEHEAEQLSSLESQLASRGSAIQNFEEEIDKIREAAVQSHITNAQKIEDLQKNLDELTTEKSTLEILNDVLRKTNAFHFEEKTALENQILDQQQSLGLILSDLNQSQEELKEFKSLDFTIENRSLLQELNQVRCEKEQMHQIHEMLFEKKENSQSIKELEMECSRMHEHLGTAEQKIHDLVKVDFLYKQLKIQFEEKKRVLHETRSALFKAETQLQTIAREEEQQESPLPASLQVEFDQLEKEIEQLQEENLQLQDLVTYFTYKLPQPLLFTANRTPLPAGQFSLEETLREALTPKKKKKAKKPAPQDLLF